MKGKDEKCFTVVWIHPLKGCLRKTHFRWQTIILGIVLLVVGVCLGVGGIFWYQGRLKRELKASISQIEALSQDIVFLEKQKEAQEEKLEALIQETENALQEVVSLRELDQKVRSILQKDLQSSLQKVGIELAFDATVPEPCLPVNELIVSPLEMFPIGMGGPALGLLTPARTVSPDDSSLYGSDFTSQTRTLESNLSRIQSETVARRKSFEEVLDIFEQGEELVDMVPLRWPTWGRVSSNYGWRNDPFTGVRAWHQGIDIAAPSGRNVVATAQGKVVYTGWNGNYGQCVIVEHKFGYQTIYGHLSRILVKTGEQVKKNQIIGQVGSTGRSTGPHLHYEVRRYGEVINPWPHLP